jgi:energy-coupling factor transporter ATP-binding protein EcfA2
VLRGTHLRIAPGELVGLLGRAGAGKTTLCLAAHGLVPHATGGIFRGRVLVAGRDTRHVPPADLVGVVGSVFQDAESQLFQTTVEDEIAFGLESLGLPPAEIDHRIDWALELVGLAGFRARSPRQLSGGQMQRVALATALAARPALLVLDEPTAFLDPRGQAEVRASLATLRRELATSMLLATQDIEWIMPGAQRVVLLVGGELRSVVGDSLLLYEERIGLPQVAQVIASLLHENHVLATDTDAAVQVLTPPRWRRQTTPLPPTPAPGPPLVVVDRLSYTYPTGIPALHEVSLEIGRGDYVALIGPNGAGKSTLARALMGLLSPTAGRVLVAGLDTRQTPVPVLARHVGYAFQNPDHQICAPSVREELAFGPRVQGWPSAEIAAVVEALLDRFRLAPWAARPPAILSYGLRRKVALAAVVASRPELLILDEPTGGLDWGSAQEMLDFLDELNRQGTTILLITHDMKIVAERALRCIVLVDGQVHFDGTPRALFARPDILAQASLAAPPVAQLAERLQVPPELGPILSVAEFLRAWDRDDDGR